MTRFCLSLNPIDATADIEAMGGEVIYQHHPCAFGKLLEPGPITNVGPFYGPPSKNKSPQLVAVGEVTLFNRSALVQALGDDFPPPPPHCTDAEILLWVYAQWGSEGLREVDGMFVLAIWAGDRLTLIRDAVGHRTVFYTYQQGGWVVSTNLHALKKCPHLKASINLAAVRSFLTFAYLPGPDTLLKDVYELGPGQYLHLKLSDTPPQTPPTLAQTYWEPTEQVWQEGAPLAGYVEHLRNLLEEVLSTQLSSTKATGIFLSGGLDSSLVTALAVKKSSHPLRTYSINFGRDLPNELAFSNLVAQHCSTQHRILTFSGTEIAQKLPETVALLDSPVGDPLTVPNYLLAQAAAEDGLSIILNGEGGDPCFGGPKNIPMLVYEWHRQNSHPLDRARAYLRSYRKCYVYLGQLLTPATQMALNTAPPLEALVSPYLEAEQMTHYVNKLMYANTRLKGAYHILSKVEKLTANWGIEGRSPLFSPKIVDYAFAIPPHYKLKGVEEKWVLKKAVEDLLPQTIVYRPKSGMRVPVQHWLEGPLRHLAQDVLLGYRTQERGIFQTATLQKWLEGQGTLWPRQGMMLWIVLTLELWLRAYVD